jgi:PAS domain S-box-containing protein
MDTAVVGDCSLSILDDCPFAVIIRDAADGSVLYFNSRLLAVLRISERALSRRSRASFYVHLVDRDTIRSMLDADGAIRNHPVAFRRADNTEFTARIWATRTKFRGRAADQFWVVDNTDSPVSVDLSDTHGDMAPPARISEAMFQAFADNVPIPMSLKGLDGRYMYVNPQFADWVGLDRDSIIGVTAIRLFSPNSARRLHRAEGTVLETGEVVTQEFDLQLFSGEVRRLLDVKFPIRDAVGRVAAIAVAMIDLTEHRRLEYSLQQAQKMEAIGQLTGGIAHDFNNMLSVILGNLDILEERVSDDGDLSAMVATAIRGAERGARLIRQLLAFSRRAFLSPRPVDMNRHVSEMLEVLHRTLGETVEIESRYGIELWPCVADPVQLEAALLNLTVNARDAMAEGGCLRIETRNVRLDDAAAAQADVTPGDYVMLAVSDTGIGIPLDIRDRVFEPFFTTKAAEKGTGLGLSMVFGFAKQSMGHVTIHSEVGHGTTVKLYLPRTEKPVAADADLPTVSPQAKGETILVVEDDSDLRTVAVTLLGTLGYDVLEARNGESAMAILADAKRIDLLLTDVVLPGGINGLRVAEAAIRQFAGIRVLYMSGYTESAILQHTHSDDGVVLLEKPFRRAELATRVREVLDA